MLGSLIFAMVFMPVLSSLFMRRSQKSGDRHHEPFVVRKLLSGYRPMVTHFVERPRIAIILALVLVVIGALIYTQPGSEFVPPLKL